MSRRPPIRSGSLRIWTDSPAGPALHEKRKVLQRSAATRRGTSHDQRRCLSGSRVIGRDTEGTECCCRYERASFYRIFRVYTEVTGVQRTLGCDVLTVKLHAFDFYDVVGRGDVKLAVEDSLAECVMRDTLSVMMISEGTVVVLPSNFVFSTKTACPTASSVKSPVVFAIFPSIRRLACVPPTEALERSRRSPTIVASGVVVSSLRRGASAAVPMRSAESELFFSTM